MIPLILSLPDYERIFRTIHGVLLNEKGDPSKACIYFGVIGAAILRAHHRLDATSVTGAAVYEFNPEEGIAFVDGKIEELNSSKTAFHCWVEVDDWIIDFQAPIFNEAINRNGTKSQIPRKMFQKNLASNLNTAIHKSNPGLTAAMIQHFTSKPANLDILKICVEWYKPCPKKMHAAIVISDQHGRTNNVVLSPRTLVGAW